MNNAARAPIRRNNRWFFRLTVLFLSLLLILTGLKKAHVIEKCPDKQYLLQGYDVMGNDSKTKELISLNFKGFDDSNGILMSESLLTSKTYNRFASFANSISKHIVEKTGDCGKNELMGQDIKIQFVYRPFYAIPTFGARPLSDLPVTPISLQEPIFPVTCSLESPWARIRLSRWPRLTLQAIFVYSERQLVMDQALLAGAKVPKPEPLYSFTLDAYQAYIKDYKNNVEDARSKDEHIRKLADIRERFPVDVMWLFDNGWRVSEPVDYLAGTRRMFIIEKTSHHYQALVKALIDQCMDTKTTKQYSNINELKAVINLDEYRIKTLH